MGVGSPDYLIEAAIAGKTDCMVAFKCDRTDGYKCEPVLLPLENVANYEKKVPTEWINAGHNGVTKEFIDYALPLIQGEPERPTENSLPRYARLKKVLAK